MRGESNSVERRFSGTVCVVTGGAGFIGSAVVGKLLEEEAHVIVLDNLATGRKSNLEEFSDRFKWAETDLRNPEEVRKVVRGVDYVFHLGAINSVPRSLKEPELAFATNVMGTLNVLLASKEAGVRRVVNVSSSSVYGGIKEEKKQETMIPRPLSPYAVSKYSAELIARNFFEVFGLDHVTLRYFNVFGPRQNPNSPYAAVIPKFFVALLKNEAPVIFGDGTQARDFTFVEDAAEGALLALLHGKSGEVYNIARGELLTLRGLLEDLYEITGRRINPVYSESRKGDVYRSGADISKAKSDLGFRPRVNVKEGLMRQMNWLKEKEPCR